MLSVPEDAIPVPITVLDMDTLDTVSAVLYPADHAWEIFVKVFDPAGIYDSDRVALTEEIAMVLPSPGPHKTVSASIAVPKGFVPLPFTK